VISTVGIGQFEPDFFKNSIQANQNALRKEIQKARKLTNGVLGVNIMVAVSDFDDMVRIAFEEEIDIQYYLGLLRRHLMLLLTVAVIASSIGAIYAFKLPDIYNAACQIIIQREETKETFKEFEHRDTEKDIDYYKTQIVIITSRNFLERVVREQDVLKPLLRSRGIAIPEDSSDERANDVAVSMVKGGLSVSRVKETRILSISYKNTNRVLCREIANAVAQTYVKQNLEEKLYAPKELLEFFPEQAETIEVETPYGKLKDISKEDLAKTLPSVANDPLIRQLKTKAAQQKAEVEKLLKTYKRKHPVVQEAEAEWQFMQDRIKIETENIVQNLKTSLASKLLVSPVRILRKAEVPGAPIGPNRWRIILMALVGALLSVGGVVFLLDYMDDSIKNQEDIEKFVQLPFLGHVPLVKTKVKDAHHRSFFVHYDPLSEISEAFRFIKVAINFSGTPGSLKCILLTSTIPAEGKSMVSSNLAASFLRDSEKVLLVDSDLRHPTVHLVAGVDNTKGLTNYLATNTPIPDLVQKTVIPNLDVIPTGPLSPNPTELFASEKMDAFITEAKELYDRIIIDSPPIIGLADSLVLGTKVDGTVMLIQTRRVSRNMVKKSKQRLLETGVKVLGLVLNRVDLERDEASYRYYAYSYRYYGKHKDKRDKEQMDQDRKDKKEGTAS